MGVWGYGSDEVHYSDTPTLPHSVTPSLPPCLQAIHIPRGVPDHDHAARHGGAGDDAAAGGELAEALAGLQVQDVELLVLAADEDAPAADGGGGVHLAARHEGPRLLPVRRVDRVHLAVARAGDDDPF